MLTYDPRIDAYIEKSADFAQPILNHLRAILHKTCPHIQETIKWGFPNFTYNDAILCNMAAFKKHCTFGFWHAALMDDPHQVLKPIGEKSAMGNLGQLQSLNDLPADKILSSYIQNAMMLIDQGIKVPRKPIDADKKMLELPPDLIAALNQNNEAKSTFENFSPSNKKEYIQWITEAKTETTRNKRLATTIEWLQQGKTRNWKYEKC